MERGGGDELGDRGGGLYKFLEDADPDTAIDELANAYAEWCRRHGVAPEDAEAVGCCPDCEGVRGANGRPRASRGRGGR